MSSPESSALTHHYDHHYLHDIVEQANPAGPHDEAAAESAEGFEGELRSTHQSEDQLPGMMMQDDV